MAMPYYVSPEQLMQDKAEFAKKGISRGRATVVMRTTDGVLFVAHNPGSALNKISEIYDRIGFAGAGRFSEFESLRKAGIRHADVTGYSYSREDVTAKSLANGYSHMLGEVFAHEVKPMEVELVVAEVGASPENDTIYRVSFDGNIIGEGDYAVVGGDADRVRVALDRDFSRVADVRASLSLCREVLGSSGAGAGANGRLSAADFEVALLDRALRGRTFRRLSTTEVAALLPA
ncbi:MAG: proteasome subunit alpha [Nitrospirota bacterium]|nr:proteasome subunit alpha [Nitrospirota bacterium]